MAASKTIKHGGKTLTAHANRRGIIYYTDSGSKKQVDFLKARKKAYYRKKISGRTKKPYAVYYER